MKAIVLVQHGSTEQLKLKNDVPLPDLEPYEVRVNVKYCALNHLDLWLRRGGTGDRLTLPRIPGSDIVGEISNIGKRVNHVHIGDHVLVYPGLSCGHCEACVHGQETQCDQFRVIGYHTDGGYAERVHVPAQNVLVIPAQELQRWAAVPVAYITAWNALVTKGRLTPNDVVAIWGAAGGLGYAALSIAQGYGAQVIGIVGSEEKAQFLRSQGFDGRVIVRTDETAKEIRRITNKTGVDLVLDHVGHATWNESLKMLKRGGRLAFCGVTTGAKTEMDLRYIFGKQLSIYGSWMGNRSDFHEVIRFLKQHALLPYIDRTFSLQEAGSAQSYMEHGEHMGKILLKID